MTMSGIQYCKTAEHIVTEHVYLATIFKEPSLPTSGGDEGTASVDVRLFNF